MANQEHLNLLAQGVEAWNQWKGDTNEVSPGLTREIRYDADLSYADLSGIDLSGINLGNIKLSNANFAGTNLSGAYLIGSELAEANFSGAQLTGADLRGARACASFSKADLRNANLSGADLSDADLRGANLSEADLSHANLSAANLQGANINRANFSGVYAGFNLLDAYLHRAEIRRAKEAGALMNQAHAERQRSEEYTRPFLKKQGKSRDIVLYTRMNHRLLRLIGASLLFVAVGIWLLLTPGDLIHVIVGIISTTLGSLGAVNFLLLFLLQLFNRTPLLIVNDEGIHYFFPFPLASIERSGMAHRDVTFKWKELGALGVIQMGRTNSLAIYTLAKRWRSGWSPSMLLSQNLLPISVKRLVNLIQEHYQVHLDAYHIANVEISDTFSSQKREEKTP